MGNKNIKTITTTKGVLNYYIDWEESDGGVYMINPLTIDRYIKIKNGHPNESEYGVFFAYGQDRFNEELAKKISAGLIKKGEKIFHWGAGLYGTKEELDRYFKWFDGRDVRIKAECDPQEVYFYEFNNHESQISWDGDEAAIRLIADIWGFQVANTIKRYRDYYELPKAKTKTA